MSQNKYTQHMEPIDEDKQSKNVDLMSFFDLNFKTLNGRRLLQGSPPVASRIALPSKLWH